jgi:predicted dehydrogenase
VIEVGIIGCGAVVHQMYAKTLIGRHEYAPRYLYDIDDQQAISAAEMLGGRTVALAELLERADAIIVTTPPSTHAALVRECLRSGRIILCEKPFVTTYAEAAAVTEEARGAGARLYISQFRRTFPQLQLARELVALGLIGEVTGFAASEGGRFTWQAVSGYTVRDRNGGVLWDTGAHTLDMALFASGLDRVQFGDVREIEVQKDKEEPSHDFLADFEVEHDGDAVSGHLHVSRIEALPNIVTISGTAGQVAFSVSMDNRVRLSTPRGSMVVVAERSHKDLLECFDLQLRSILLSEGDQDFAAENFLNQVELLEVLANAR